MSDLDTIMNFNRLLLHKNDCYTYINDNFPTGVHIMCILCKRPISTEKEYSGKRIRNLCNIENQNKSVKQHLNNEIITTDIHTTPLLEYEDSTE